MLAFPLLATLGSVAAIALVIALFRQWLGDLGPGGLTSASAGPGLLTIMGLTYVAFVFQRLWSSAMRVALSRAAIDLFQGKPRSVSATIATVLRRIGAIATYIVVEAGVRRVLQRLRDRVAGKGLLGFAVTQVAELAWWATSYFVIPVLAYEERRGLEAIERSASLFRATWGAAFLGRLRVDAVWGIGLLCTALGIVLFAVLEIEEPQVLAWMTLPPLVIAAPVAFVVNILDTIYRSALYLFAAEALRPDAYAEDGLDVIFSKQG